MLATQQGLVMPASRWGSCTSAGLSAGSSTSEGFDAGLTDRMGWDCMLTGGSEKKGVQSAGSKGW